MTPLRSMRLAPWRLLFSLGAPLGGNATRSRETQLQAAPEFLFERRPFQSNCAAPPAGASVAYLVNGRHLSFQRKHAQNLTFPLSEVLSLTLTAGESNMIHIVGSDRDSWVLDFCRQGEGNTEPEALAQLEQVSRERIGGTVSLNNRGTHHTRLSPNTLLVAAPATTSTIAHASFAAVHVQDMAGPVRVTAIHARATILDTGKSRCFRFRCRLCRLKRNSEAQFRKGDQSQTSYLRFEGSLVAWAQRPVRVLVPRSFQTPFQAIVSRPQDFGCRADICSKITPEKQALCTSSPTPAMAELLLRRSTFALNSRPLSLTTADSSH